MGSQNPWNLLLFTASKWWVHRYSHPDTVRRPIRIFWSHSTHHFMAIKWWANLPLDKTRYHIDCVSITSNDIPNSILSAMISPFWPIIAMISPRFSSSTHHLYGHMSHRSPPTTRCHWRRSCTCDVKNASIWRWGWNQLPKKRSIDTHTHKTTLYHVSRVIWCEFSEPRFHGRKKGLWGNQYGNPTAISDANVHHIIPSSKGQLHRHRSNRGCFKRTSDTSGYMRYKPDINRITITKSPISFWQIEWYIFSKCKYRTAQPWLAILRKMRCELIWVPTTLWKKSAANDQWYAPMISSSFRWLPKASNVRWEQAMAWEWC